MFPSLEAIQDCCEVNQEEIDRLLSPESPIVLLQRRQQCRIPEVIAPGHPTLGIMLPYTPLHHLLMQLLGSPVVATSGNLSREPICVAELEALQHLNTMADGFLIHNRPLVRPLEDSVVRILLGQEQVLRRGRGYAPYFLPFPSLPAGILAVGGHLKNTIAITLDNQILLSQFLGDLETVAALSLFQKTIQDLQHLYRQTPQVVACDLHPDYHSTQFAQALGIPVIPVQHHYAHVLSCMAENQLLGAQGTGTALGIAWDGSGYGPDQTLWGGEFLQITDTGFQRVAALRPFPLPGGAKAVQEPRRAALGLLYAAWGEEIWLRQDLNLPQGFTTQELTILQTMLDRGLNSPLTSSVGRFLDAVASLLGICHYNTYEGEAAMALEFLAEQEDHADIYPFSLQKGSVLMLDWLPMLAALLKDLSTQVTVARMAGKVHNTLVQMIVAVAQAIGESKIMLTGGCFQNRYLTELAVKQLQQAGFRPYWHHQVPPNDAGLALGQVMAAVRDLAQK
jgi:hydrogenase maturation protein HypF